MKAKTILMAVGSSGGHIYPALAIAEKLEELAGASDVQMDIHFVHSGSDLGAKILSSFKYSIHKIPIGGLAKGRSVFHRLKTLFQLPIAFIYSIILIRKLKPQVVFGTGGAVTGPVLISARLMFCKTAVWEANAVMGLTNYWLSFFVSRVFTVFSDLKGVPTKKQIVCSYPLRNKAVFQNQLKEKTLNEHSSKLQNQLKTETLNEQPTALQQTEHSNADSVEFPKDLFKVLILGGSQGSVLLNTAVSQALEEESWRKDIFIYHQTGEKSFSFLQKKYNNLKAVKCFSFSFNIEKFYENCDLIFSRSGAGAIWTAAFYKKPLVLIPLTHSAGGHQLKNALNLFSRKCVEMIEEQSFNKEIFKNKLMDLKKNQEKRRQLSQSLGGMFQGSGAKKIAEWILSE